MSYSGVIFCTDRSALYRVKEHIQVYGHEDETEIVQHEVRGTCYSISYYEEDYVPLSFGGVDRDIAKHSKYIEHILAGLAWRWDVHCNTLGKYHKVTSHVWDCLDWGTDPFETKLALKIIQHHNGY